MILYVTYITVIVTQSNNIKKNIESLSGMVHTGGKSPQDRLGNMQTYGTTLASAYMLYCLSATWLQLQIIERSLRWE